MQRKLIVALALGLCSAGHIAAADTKVGDTKDACDQHDAVTVTGKAGKVTITAGSAAQFDLPAPVREITWFCGKSREASSNDIPYDRVKLSRKANGAMTWEFIRLSPPAAPGPGTPVTTARTGDTADACDGHDAVTFRGKAGTVTVKASETLVADLASAVTELAWKCGGSQERVANDSPFDQVRVARSGNGAIRWVFYLKAAAPDPVSVCSKVHAFGRLMFKDDNGTLQPLKRAQVKLMDEDFGPHDQEMARGLTSDDGRFDLTGAAADSGCAGAGCKRPDPYLEFVLEQDHRIDVRDPLGNSARQHTATRPDTCGDIDFHTQEWAGAELDAILYAHGQAAYDNFTKLTGEARVPGNDGLVGIEYPTVLIWNTPYTTWDTIHWQWHGDGKTQFSALDHEFGHRLRHAADGNTDHFNWDATRFRYLRNHSPSDITNEGFAFNEGWAEYHKTLLHPGTVGMTWTSPVGDNVEGDVASQLLRLATTCGGFPRLWATMKGAGANAFHSVDEFRAEFMKRNPACSDSAPAAPAPPAPAPAAAAPDTQLATQIRGELADRTRRLAIPHLRSALRPGGDLPAASQSVVETLGDRHAARLAALHGRAVQAHAHALGGLVLSPEALSDGSYARAVTAARAQLAKELGVALVQHAQDTRKDIAVLRGKATEPALQRYLDAVSAANARAEADAAAGKTELPRSFWPTTVSHR
jgi:transthyretin-like family protein